MGVSVPQAGDVRWERLSETLTLGEPATKRTAVGRYDIVRRIFDLVSEAGNHGVLMGEPGIGKSTVLNVATQELRDAGVIVLRTAAEPELGFDALIRAAAADVHVAPDDEMRFALAPADSEDAEPLVDMLPEGEATPAEIAELFDQQLAGHPVLIVDDYETVGASMTDRAISDLIKTLGESASQATVILAGTGDNADDLHANHDRTFKYVTEIQLRLLRPAETFYLLDRMAEAADIAFGDDAKKLMLTASLGIPAAVQGLGRGSIGAAIESGASEVGVTEAVAGMQAAAADLDPGLREAVDEIVGDDVEDEFLQMVFAIAAAHTDWYGRFFKPQIMQSIRHRYPHIEADESEVLAMIDSLAGTDSMCLFRHDGSAYRFRNIWLKHYLLMRYLGTRFGVSNLAPMQVAAG